MKRDAEATRQRILSTAKAEFSAHGIAGARVDRIADAAGANKALIYAYFGSKNGLFDAVFDAVVVRNTVEVPIDATDLPEYAARLSDQYQKHPEVVRLANWDRLERDGEGSKIPAVIEATRHKREEVVRAQRAGLVSDRLPAPVLLELIYAIATSRFDFASAEDVPTPNERRQAVRDAVTRLIRP